MVDEDDDDDEVDEVVLVEEDVFVVLRLVDEVDEVGLVEELVGGGVEVAVVVGGAVWATTRAISVPEGTLSP